MPSNLSEAMEYLATEMEKDLKEYEFGDQDGRVENYVRMIRMAVMMTKEKPVSRVTGGHFIPDNEE